MRSRRGWLVPALALALAGLPLVVATVRTLSGGWMAIGDNGLILLRAEDVATAHHPLLGTWTSASQAAGRTISNPGPLWFDVLAPFVKVAGPSVGLALAVMVSNLAAIAGAAWAAQRVGGRRGMVLTTALSAGLAWSMGSELLFDAWQPHAMLLPFWCLLVMCWALAAGDLLMAPFVIAIASLLVQTHLSFVYVVAIIGAGTVLMAAVGLARLARVGGASWDAERSWLGRMSLWSAGLAVVAWCQPLLDQVFGAGNLGALLTSSNSGGDNERVGLALGARFVASVVALPPWWARSGFSSIIRATGVVDDPKGRTLAEGDVAGSTAALFGLLAVAVVLVAVVVIGLRWRSRPIATIGILSAVAVAAALVSMVFMPIGVIGISPHQMRWLWPISALALLSVAVTAAEWQPLRRAAVPVGLGVTALFAVVNLPTYAAPEGPTADRRDTATAAALVDELESYRPGGPVLFDISVLRFAEPYSGPVLAALARNGVAVVVEDDGMVRQLGERRRADGEEQDRLVLLEGAAAEEPPAGSRTIALVEGLDQVGRGELAALSADVVELAGETGLELSSAGEDAVRAGRIDFGQVVLPAGGDAGPLEASGELADLVANGYLDLDAAVADRFERYADLRRRQDRQTVGLFELPVDSP